MILAAFRRRVASPQRRFGYRNARFDAHSRIERLELAQAGYLLAASIAIAFAAMAASEGSGRDLLTGRQALRLIIAGALLAGAFTIWKYRSWSLRHWRALTVFPPLAAMCALAIAPLFPADMGSGGTDSLLVSIVLGLWLASVFTRVPLTALLPVAVLGAAVVLYARSEEEPRQSVVDGLYLAVAIVTAAVGSSRVSRLERERHVRTRELVRLNRRLRGQSEKLAVSLEERRRLVAQASHDIRQPLAGLAIYLAPMRESLGGPGGRDRLLVEQVHQSLQAIGRNLEELLRASLPPGMSVLDSIEEVDVTALLPLMVEECMPLAREANVAIVLRHRKQVAKALTSRRIVVSAIANLLGNAIRHAHGGDRRPVTVHIGCVSVGSTLRIDIRDNGIGLACASCSEEGGQNSVAPSQSRGMGVGLNLVRDSLASMPGHRLAIRSLPGRGVRASVYVPRFGSSVAFGTEGAETLA